MKTIVYKQNRQLEIMKIYFLLAAISFMGIVSFTVSFFSERKTAFLFALPFFAIFIFMYISFREFIKSGADIEINAENFVINDKVFEFSSLIEVGQCKNRHLIYFIFRENHETNKFVGFNRFTHKEMLILNDKTEFVDMIKKLGRLPV